MHLWPSVVDKHALGDIYPAEESFINSFAASCDAHWDFHEIESCCLSPRLSVLVVYSLITESFTVPLIFYLYNLYVFS